MRAVGPEEVLRFYGSKRFPTDLEGVEWSRSCPLPCERPTERRFRLNVTLTAPFPWHCDSPSCQQSGEFLEFCDRLKTGSALSKPLSPERVDAIRCDLHGIWSALQAIYALFADPETGPTLQQILDRALRRVLLAGYHDEDHRHSAFHTALKWIASRWATEDSLGRTLFLTDSDAFTKSLTRVIYWSARAAAKSRQVRRLATGQEELQDWPDQRTIDSVQSSRRYTELHAALDVLTPEDWQIAEWLLTLPNVTGRQIAQLLGVSEPTASRRINRVLTQLGELLQERSHVD